MKQVTRQMSVRRRGRRKPAASQTRHFKRGAMSDLKATLTEEQYQRLERAVNRHKRGLLPEKPPAAHTRELEDEQLEDAEQLEDELVDPPLMETSTPERWCEQCAKHRPSPKCGVCGGPTLEARP